MNLKKWRIKESKYLIQDQWITLRADRCETSDGVEINPYYVMEESDWAHVVVFDTQNRILIVWQYRHGSGTICAELPAGAVDASDASPLEAARRELLEETGCTAENYESLGAVFANPGRQNNRVHCFMGYDAKPVTSPELEVTEEIEFEFININTLFQLIDAGDFSQSLHISSVFLALRKRGLLNI